MQERVERTKEMWLLESSVAGPDRNGKKWAMAVIRI